MLYVTIYFVYLYTSTLFVGPHYDFSNIRYWTYIKNGGAANSSYSLNNIL